MMAGDILPVSELNGVAPKTVAPTPSVKEGIEASSEAQTEILNNTTSG